MCVFLFLQYVDTVGWVFWPVKTVARITYTVLEETLNHAQSINLHLNKEVDTYFLFKTENLPQNRLHWQMCDLFFDSWHSCFGEK